MRLLEIEVNGLRNLRDVRLELPPGLTLIAGRNGQGKTSLLEAVYLLGTGRSFRTRRGDEIMHWDGGPLRLVGRVSSIAGTAELKVLMDGGERRLVADGRERTLDQFLGRLDVVDLTADRMNVLRDGPEERRRFLDRGVLGLSPAYLHALGDYRRVLQQRNALLRGRFRHDPSGARGELRTWEERLLPAAVEIHRLRRDYALRLTRRLDEPTRILFPDGPELRLEYRPSPAAAAEEAPEDYGRVLTEAFARGRERDRAVGHTGVGPHRDDFRVNLGQIDLRRFGSAGQARASMIALKLGKLSLLRQAKGESPLFLMDDFDSDLDEVRANALAGFLNQGDFQALVATSKEDMIERMAVSFAKVRMAGGEATPA